MIAKFSNNYKTLLNGNVEILGDLYSSSKIDCYRYTATEIIQRDTENPLLIKKFLNATAIKIDNVAVEIQQRLKATSSTNSSFSHGLSVGNFTSNDSNSWH